MNEVSCTTYKEDPMSGYTRSLTSESAVEKQRKEAHAAAFQDEKKVVTFFNGLNTSQQATLVDLLETLGEQRLLHYLWKRQMDWRTKSPKSS